jgi:hypothetical protein
MILKVNGEAKTIDQERLAVTELLFLCAVESPEMVTVQLNRKFLSKDQYASLSSTKTTKWTFFIFWEAANERIHHDIAARRNAKKGSSWFTAHPHL